MLKNASKNGAATSARPGGKREAQPTITDEIYKFSRQFGGTGSSPYKSLVTILASSGNDETLARGALWQAKFVLEGCTQADASQLLVSLSELTELVMTETDLKAGREAVRDFMNFLVFVGDPKQRLQAANGMASAIIYLDSLDLGNTRLMSDILLSSTGILNDSLDRGSAESAVKLASDALPAAAASLRNQYSMLGILDTYRKDLSYLNQALRKDEKKSGSSSEPTVGETLSA